jgi:tetratricopeptide (TPR) repeat protein
MNLGIVDINMGNDVAAHPLLKQALAIYEETDDKFFIGTAMVHLGNVSLGLGRPQEALSWLEKAYPLSHEVGDEWLISFALNNLGEVARVMGDYALARRYYEESEALLRATGDKGDWARLVHNLGCVAQHEGNFEVAEKQLRESLSLFRKLGNQRGIAECLAALARQSAALQQPQAAARILGTAEGLLAVSGAAWWPADRGEIQRCREALKASLGEESFGAEFARGRRLSVDQALETFARGE